MKGNGHVVCLCLFLLQHCVVLYVLDTSPFDMSKERKGVKNDGKSVEKSALLDVGVLPK